MVTSYLSTVHVSPSSVYNASRQSTAIMPDVHHVAGDARTWSSSPRRRNHDSPDSCASLALPFPLWLRCLPPQHPAYRPVFTLFLQGCFQEDAAAQHRASGPWRPYLLPPPPAPIPPSPSAAPHILKASSAPRAPPRCGAPSRLPPHLVFFRPPPPLLPYGAATAPRAMVRGTSILVLGILLSLARSTLETVSKVFHPGQVASVGWRVATLPSLEQSQPQLSDGLLSALPLLNLLPSYGLPTPSESLREPSAIVSLPRGEALSPP